MKRASYVTPDHLLESLLKRGWFPKRQAWNYQPWRVGVCVSGGPDSMALAYLLQNIPHPFAKGVRAFSPYALIVDHDAREGSQEEALWVKHRLEAMNIDTYVQKLEWRSDVDPKSMRGFEMKARDKRYSALVRLATANQLRDLFTGHHEDDQVETIMLRLVRDNRLNPLSFRGMPLTSTVPTADELQASSTFSHCCSDTPLSSHGSLSSVPPRAENYRLGMRLHRPLLEYQKDQLIATCDHFNIPYVQDKTNFNPQLTPRNAIRSTRTHYKLPEALRSGSMLDLCAKANQIYIDLEEQARRFLSTHVEEFYLTSETGVLSLRLKELSHPMTETQSGGFSLFMQRAISLVSPLKDESLPSLLNREHTQQMYALCTSRPVQVSTKPTSLVYNQVVCTRQIDLSPKTTTLHFARQPVSSSMIYSLTQGVEPDEASIVEGTGLLYSRWIHWDGRFWIRVHGTKDAVTKTTIRPYTPSDVSAVKMILKKSESLYVFEKILSVYAPGNIRFTLPVLLVTDQIIAFPTLNVLVGPNPLLSWQVLYSRSQRAADFFFPNIRDGETVIWSIEKGPCVGEGHILSIKPR